MKYIIDKSFSFCYGHRVHNQRLDTKFTESGDACLACIPSDTKILLEDGETTIGEWEKNPVDKMVKCVNDYGEETLKRGHSPRITKTVTELMEITIDDEIFRCTVDHKIRILRNDILDWIEAQHLELTDEIVSI